jgi:hypothetical protein
MSRISVKRLILALALVLCLASPAGAGWYIDDEADFYLRTRGYLMRDEFVTDRAAGAVNGTLSEYSGHTRTVTDTKSKLSITGGALTFSGGKAAPSDGDPAFWVDLAITRAVGKTLMTGLTVTDVTSVTEFGWDTGKAGAVSENALRITADTLKVYDSGSAGPTVYVPADATAYSLAISLRATGAWYFAKIGTTWKLLWISATGNTASLYAGISNYSAASAYTRLASPSTLYAPSPLLSDSFNRADGPIGSSDGAGHAESTGLGAGGSGLAWSAGTISSNTAVITPTESASLWDANASTFEGAGTYAWTAYGGNTMTNDANSLKITYVDNGGGGREFFANSSDLSADLTIGGWYRFEASAKVSAGGSVGVSTTGAFPNTVTVTATNFTTITSTNRATNATTNTATFSGMGAGESIWLDNISLKPLALASLFSCPTTPFSTADIVATTTLPTFVSGTLAGLVVNLDSLTTPTALVIAYLDGAGNAKVDELAGGTWTNKISGAITYGAAKELRVVRDGTYCALYYNNALVGSVSTMTSNTNKYHGLFSTNSGNTFENFNLYPRGSENQYSRLNWF